MASVELQIWGDIRQLNQGPECHVDFLGPFILYPQATPYVTQAKGQPVAEASISQFFFIANFMTKLSSTDTISLVRSIGNVLSLSVGHDQRQLSLMITTTYV